ncbi:MAG: ABC transporter permease [Trueperaceae bacterium]
MDAEASRSPARPRRPAAGLAVSGAWLPALFALVAWWALPIGRPGRPFLTLEPDLYAAAIGHPLLWLTLAASAVALALSFLPLSTARRADLILAVGAVGLTAVVLWFMVGRVPFGIGALVVLSGLVLVLGNALSESGRVQGDAFIASSILFVSSFVVLFILYPLFMVLRSSVFVDGAFDLSVFVRTLQHPLFLMLGNPLSDVDEVGMALRWSAGGAVALAALAAWNRRRWPTVLARIALGGVLGFVVGVMLYGNGALPTSLLLVTIVAPTTTMLGLAFALLGQRARIGAVRRSLDVISILPIITPPFVLSFAMIFLLGRRGLITYNLLDQSSSWIFGLPGVAIAQILSFTPIAYLLLRGSMSSLNPALEEAAQTLGANAWVTLRTITWPLVRPGLAAAFLLSMIESLADFGNPIILGGNRKYMATEVYLSLTGRFNPNEAAVYGAILLLLVLGAFFLQRWWLGGGSFVTVTGKPTSGAIAPLPRLLETLLVAVLFVWSVSVAALYLSIAVGSFAELWGVNYAFTLRHYQDFFTGAGVDVFLFTARVAAISAVPAMLLGFLVAYLVARQRFWGRRFVEFGSLLSFATPGTVMGVAYIFAFNTGPVLLTASATIIVIALVFRNMPVAIRAAVAGLAQIDPSLEEASTMLRAKSFTTMRRVLFPLLINTLVTGLIFAFVTAMTAVSQVIFLVSPGNQFATVLLLGWVDQGQLGRAAAMGTILIVTLLLVIVVVLQIAKMLGNRMVGVRT